MTANAWQQVVRGSAVPWYGARYRRWVLDSLRYVDVQDLATGGDHIPELSDVYVDVALVSRAPGEASASAPGRVEATPERHSISELLDRRSRVVLALIGQPGSGKSTLLAHAARRSAQQTLLGHPGRRRVPVLLALREHAGSIIADPSISLPAVMRAAVGDAAGREPAGWWERQLRRGRCLVLLDGLDEIASADDRLGGGQVGGAAGRRLRRQPLRDHFQALRPARSAHRGGGRPRGPAVHRGAGSALP